MRLTTEEVTGFIAGESGKRLENFLGVDADTGEPMEEKQ
jgi:hypothetical protein